MLKILIIIFSLLPLMSLGQRSLITNSIGNIDNENEFSIRSYVGYKTSLDSIFRKKKSNIAILGGYRYYSSPQLYNRFNEIKAHFDSKLSKNLTLNSNSSLVFNQDWMPLTYDVSLTYRWRGFHFEGFGEREMLGIARTNEYKIISNFWGISVDWSPISRLTLVTSQSYNKFSDGNDRFFTITRAIYTFENQNFFIDVKSKVMRGGEFRENYFSPQTLSQNNLGIGYNTMLIQDKTLLKVYGGGGIQDSDGYLTAMYILDIRLSNRISNKINSEIFLAFRNFDAYLWGYGTMKLSYLIN